MQYKSHPTSKHAGCITFQGAELGNKTSVGWGGVGWGRVGWGGVQEGVTLSPCIVSPWVYEIKAHQAYLA